ncbi:MAG TPA: uracil-DNA glycosylase [Chloroflexi bacterium]|nr:uracil-DNA glycosylase [Chloroflexota bacterium]
MPSQPQVPAPTAPVNCWQCRHFATSWDPALPYSCKLLGFKTRMLPSMQVMQIDGRPCQGFAPKTALPKGG